MDYVDILRPVATLEPVAVRTKVPATGDLRPCPIKGFEEHARVMDPSSTRSPAPPGAVVVGHDGHVAADLALDWVDVKPPPVGTGW
jgi:hypothetical protein